MRAILERARDDRRAQLEAAGNAERALVLMQWAGAIWSDLGQHAARVDLNLWAEALRDRKIGVLARGSLAEATKAVSKVVAPNLPTDGEPVKPDAVASVLIALFLGLEVQTAVGVPMDPGEVLRVLGSLFEPYMPAKKARRKRPPR